MRPDVLEFLGRRHYVATRGELLDIGVSNSQLRAALDRGELERIGEGLYRLAGSPPTFEQRCRIAVAPNPEIVVSVLPAARLWQWRRTDAIAMHVSAPGSVKPRGDARFHRTTLLDPRDVVERDDGIRLTSAARTIVDLAAVLPVEFLQGFARQAKRAHLTTDRDIARTAYRLIGRGRKGSATMRQLLAIVGAGVIEVDSRLEAQFERQLIAAGLPAPTRQHAVTLSNGRQVRFDFAYPDRMLAIEIDSITYHDDLVDRRADYARDRAAAVDGWMTMRVHELDVMRRTQAPLDDIRRAHETRTPRVA